MSILNVLNGAMFHMQLRSGDCIKGQNDCHSTCRFQKSIAGMTLQSRLVLLISSKDLTMAWQGLEERMEKARTSFRNDTF